MKRNFVVLALAFVFLTCAGNQPKPQPQIKKPIPEFDSVRVGIAKRYCGEDIFKENGKPVPCAEPFLKKGEPTGFWQLNDVKGAEYYIFSWRNQGCVMMSNYLDPPKVYSRPALFQGIGSAFPQDFSELNQSANIFVSLPQDGKYEVIVVSDVGLAEINVKTHASRQLQFKTEVFAIQIDEEGKEKEVAVMEIDHQVNLEPWTWIASRSGDLSGFSVPDHSTLTLFPGEYRFKMRAIGSDKCQGKVEFDRTLPGRQSIGADISNLLVVDPKPPTGDLNSLIERWGRQDLWPTSNYYSGSVVQAFAEARVDSVGEYVVEIALEKYSENAKPDTAREVIFSQVCLIGKTATLLEVNPNFTGIKPGAYWMTSTVTKPGSRVRAESISLIRVKEGQSLAETVPAIYPSVTEAPKITESIIDEFTDSELKAIFKIVGPDLSVLIDTITNTDFLRANVIEYLKRKDISTRPDTPENEWWTEKVRRYNWCVENLKTKIDVSVVDNRWHYVMLLGLDFDGNPSLASMPTSDADVSKYRLRWKDGTELEFETATGGSIPIKTKVIKPGSDLVVTDALGRSGESDRPKGADYSALIGGTRDLNEILSEGSKFDRFEGVEKALNTNLVMACLFSSEFGDYEEDEPFFETWWFALTNANEFSESALVHDSLSHRLIVRDTVGEIVGDNEEGQTGLSFFLALSRQERKTFFFPSVNAGGLGPGIYSANFSLRANGGKELASYQIDRMQIPPRTASLIDHESGYWGTSDILFPTQLIKEGSPGILIDGKLYYNSPVGIFSNADSLPILIQVKTPAEEEYEVRVFLYQIDKDEDVFRRISQPSERSQAEEYLVYNEKLKANDRGLTLFEGDFDLSVLKPGKAAIIIRVLDPEIDPDSEDQPQAISYRRFLVVKPK